MLARSISRAIMRPRTPPNALGPLVCPYMRLASPLLRFREFFSLLPAVCIASLLPAGRPRAWPAAWHCRTDFVCVFGPFRLPSLCRIINDAAFAARLAD